MNDKLSKLINAGAQNSKKGSFFLLSKRITEIPISDKPSPYKLHYFDKEPRYLVISPQFDSAINLLK